MFKVILVTLCKLPFFRRFSKKWYSCLGVKFVDGGGIMFGVKIVGDYNNIVLHKNCDINDGCFLLAKAKIEVGDNSALAYGVSIITSADPNHDYNPLAKLYPPLTAPVVIGNNCWVGANSTILPGVTIGDFSVIAAGSVVTKDVPSGVMVAGVPATIKKQLKNFGEDLMNDI